MRIVEILTGFLYWSVIFLRRSPSWSWLREGETPEEDEEVEDTEREKPTIV